MGVRPALLAALCLVAPAAVGADTAQERFRQANELVRTGDYPRAVSGYAALARDGAESATLYWNWAQAATAQGAHGEALWALLRARELDPGDRAVVRDVERLRAALNLDAAEIGPEPLLAAGRFGRRFRLDLLAAALLALSVAAHAVARVRAGTAFVRGLAWASLALGLASGAVAVAASLARPTAAVVRRGATLFDAASPSANATGALREGEVVPVLETSGDWLRVEDNAGARGWARPEDVRRLDVPPGYAPDSAAQP